MAGQAFAEFIRRWERFNNALKPLLPQLPHLAADQADFEVMVAEAKELDNQQKLLRGKLQDTTQQRRAIFLKSVDLHERLATQLKGKLGLRNQNLVGFGLQPRKVPKRRKTDGTNPPPPVQPPQTPPPPPIEVQSPGAGALGAKEVTPSAAAK
ncbi:MAG TPA: hypothetical protein VFE33_28535 [Thermoanaerobaculia bacterium]|nr:hypothetical protein [Thermoanaerobaculia bacterium]